jgi:hypothetical protein
MIDEHRLCVQNSIYRTGLLRSLTMMQKLERRAYSLAAILEATTEPLGFRIVSCVFAIIGI